jgi:hypothetical protein
MLTTRKLNGLAEKIHDAHRECETAARTAVEAAMRAGDALIEAKSECPHGRWSKWLKSNCNMSPRSAQLYMKLARNRGAIEKRNAVALLTVRDAAALVSTPRETEPSGSLFDVPLPETGEKVIGSVSGDRFIELQPSKNADYVFIAVSHLSPGDGWDPYCEYSKRPVRRDAVGRAVSRFLDSNSARYGIANDVETCWCTEEAKPIETAYHPQFYNNSIS